MLASLARQLSRALAQQAGGGHAAAAYLSPSSSSAAAAVAARGRRLFTAGRQATDGERRIESVLRAAFPGTRSLTVEDVSGGCGQMYQVHIVAEEFRGAKVLAQHRMVKSALAEHIRDMHGLSIATEAPAATGAFTKKC